jgi:predicted SAM-dependent methyltransferase
LDQCGFRVKFRPSPRHPTGLPFESNSVDIVYNEYFIEHLFSEEGTRVLCEFFRCLKVGGVLRIATPDLDYIIHKYNTDWSDQDWLSWPGHEAINAKGKMIDAIKMVGP